MLTPASSVLVSAPSGSGVKRSIVHELHSLRSRTDMSGEPPVSLVHISISTLQPRHGSGESSEQMLRTALHGALALRPCVVYLDRIEGIAPNSRRFSDGGGLEDSSAKLTQV